MTNPKERFFVSHQEGPSPIENIQKTVLVDIITGVNYLILSNSKGGIAVTPLLGKNNEVIISK